MSEKIVEKLKFDNNANDTYILRDGRISQVDIESWNDKQSVKSVITDSASTQASISIAAANTDYIFNQPLDSLTIDAFESSDTNEETTFYFTVGEDGLNFSIPETLEIIGEVPDFEAETSYIMNVCNNIAVFGKITA